MTKEKMIKSVNDYFTDTNRSVKETVGGLKEVEELARSMIEALEAPYERS